MTPGRLLVPHVGSQPNPLIPVWAEIVLQLLLLALLVAIVVVVVRALTRRRSSGVPAEWPGGGLSPQQAYEAAYRFVADAARSREDAGLRDLAASMQPVRDAYEGEDTQARAAWRRAVEETTGGRPLPRP